MNEQFVLRINDRSRVLCEQSELSAKAIEPTHIENLIEQPPLTLYPGLAGRKHQTLGMPF